MSEKSGNKGLTAHYLYTFGVLQDILQEGSGKSVFARLRQTLTRASGEPASRILQIDVASKRVNAIADESVKESLAVEELEVQSALVKGGHTSQLTAILQDGKTISYDFQTVHDAQLFRGVFEDVQMGTYSGIRIPRTVIKRGTIQRQERGGTYSERFAVLVPQKLFLLRSRAASFPLSVISLAEVAPFFDELTRSITLQVGSKSYVLRGLTEDDAQGWSDSINLGCAQKYSALGMPALVQRELNSRASTVASQLPDSLAAAQLSSSPEASPQSRSAQPAMRREASLGNWARNSGPEPGILSPAEWKPDEAADFLPAGWKANEAADFSPGDCKPDDATDFGPAEWKPDDATDVGPTAWKPDDATDFGPAEWKLDDATDFSPADWKPDEAASFSPSEWQADSPADFGLSERTTVDATGSPGPDLDPETNHAADAGPRAWQLMSEPPLEEQNTSKRRDTKSIRETSAGNRHSISTAHQISNREWQLDSMMSDPRPHRFSQISHAAVGSPQEYGKPGSTSEAYIERARPSQIPGEQQQYRDQPAAGERYATSTTDYDMRPGQVQPGQDAAPKQPHLPLEGSSSSADAAVAPRVGRPSRTPSKTEQLRPYQHDTRSPRAADEGQGRQGASPSRLQAAVAVARQPSGQPQPQPVGSIPFAASTTKTVQQAAPMGPMQPSSSNGRADAQEERRPILGRTGSAPVRLPDTPGPAQRRSSSSLHVPQQQGQDPVQGSMALQGQEKPSTRALPFPRHDGDSSSTNKPATTAASGARTSLLPRSAGTSIAASPEHQGPPSLLEKSRAQQLPLQPASHGRRDIANEQRKACSVSDSHTGQGTANALLSADLQDRPTSVLRSPPQCSDVESNDWGQLAAASGPSSADSSCLSPRGSTIQRVPAEEIPRNPSSPVIETTASRQSATEATVSDSTSLTKRTEAATTSPEWPSDINAAQQRGFTVQDASAPLPSGRELTSVQADEIVGNPLLAQRGICSLDTFSPSEVASAMKGNAEVGEEAAKPADPLFALEDGNSRVLQLKMTAMARAATVLQATAAASPAPTVKDVIEQIQVLLQSVTQFQCAEGLEPAFQDAAAEVQQGSSMKGSPMAIHRRSAVHKGRSQIDADFSQSDMKVGRSPKKQRFAGAGKERQMVVAAVEKAASALQDDMRHLQVAMGAMKDAISQMSLTRPPSCSDATHLPIGNGLAGSSTPPSLPPGHWTWSPGRSTVTAEASQQAQKGSNSAQHDTLSPATVQQADDDPRWLSAEDLAEEQLMFLASSRRIINAAVAAGMEVEAALMSVLKTRAPAPLKAQQQQSGDEQQSLCIHSSSPGGRIASTLGEQNAEFDEPRGNRRQRGREDRRASNAHPEPHSLSTDSPNPSHKSSSAFADKQMSDFVRESRTQRSSPEPEAASRAAFLRKQVADVDRQCLGLASASHCRDQLRMQPLSSSKVTQNRGRPQASRIRAGRALAGAEKPSLVQAAITMRKHGQSLRGGTASSIGSATFAISRSSKHNVTRESGLSSDSSFDE